MYCKNCGKVISDDSVFCSYCGSKLTANCNNNSTNHQVSNNKSSHTAAYFWVLILSVLIVIFIFSKSNDIENNNIADKEPIDKIIKEIGEEEPSTGTELVRTFQYQGGGKLIATAENNSALITVANTENPSEYLRFYVRKGETAEVSIPTGVYKITYTTGSVWYGIDSEFGSFGMDGYFEDVFEFTFYQDNAWISNTIWEITV